MDNFWVVTLFHLQPTQEQWLDIQTLALEEKGALGIEEFSLNEEEVDALLGTRSYSGGDLPQEVLDEVESRVLSRPTNYRFFFDEKSSAQSFLESIQLSALCESQLDEVAGEDWNTEWRKHYSPIKVNDDLEIIPSWHKGGSFSSKEQIYIYPGMGFGTGSHETTFLCLKLFTEEIVPKHQVRDVLDFGSGSGILGLGTFKFYPDARVDFYDIDLEANKNCYHNAEVNDLTERSFRLLLPEFRDRLLNSYDLVFANILEGILLQEKEALISYTAAGGHLIVSGLLSPQTAGIIEAYSGAGLKLLKQLDKGDWSALLFAKEKL